MSRRLGTTSTIFILSLVLLFVDTEALTRAKVTLQDNGYRGLVVAINEDIPENPRLVEGIKDLFSDTSNLLHGATKKRAYFKEITILIPKTWSDNITSELATNEIFDTANVIIDEPHTLWGDNPYANQLGSCGEEGEYIHLTPNFLLDTEWTLETFGDPARVLVHEWGHYRWGLFDEYSTSDDGHFYLNQNGHVEVTRCSKYVAGFSWNTRTDEKCNTKPESGVLPDKYCRFYPDLVNNKATGSFMYMSFLEQVVDFCHGDKNGDLTSMHNSMAPNKQNTQCKNKSAWDVMSASVDFAKDSNPPRDVTDTTPTFNILKAAPLRVVLLLDVSGSMATNDRIGILNQLATKYIQATVIDGSLIGLVEFTSIAYVTSYLREITSSVDRTYLANLLPTIVQTKTCIGCALLTGIEVLEYGGKSAKGGILLLITDGEETAEPLIQDVKSQVISKEVIVDTVAFGYAADEKLASLSQDTGGISFFYSEGEDSTALNDALTATITKRTGGSSSTPIQLQSKKISLSNGHNKITGNIVIDSTIGRETKFFFLWSSSEVSVTITRPNGLVIDSTSSEYVRDHNKKMVIGEISGVAEPGEWTYEITGPDQSVEISIQSKVKDSTQPIQVTTKVGDMLVTDSAPKVNIYAQVTKGYTPILKAQVTAIVERPAPYSPTTITLRDNGAGIDVTKNDGVYSGVFLDFVTATCPNCRYNVKVIAEDPNGLAEVPVTSAWGIRSEVLPIKPPGPSNDTGGTNDTERTGQFNREVSGGVIQAPVTVDPGDAFPPSRITDLRVVETSYENQTVTLKWTAPGNDLDSGTAYRYELRYSTNFTAFVQDFTTGEEIASDNVTGANLTSPKPFGSEECHTIRMVHIQPNVTMFFSVRAIDESGNEADPSNIISVGIFPDVTPTTSTTFPTTKPKITNNPNNVTKTTLEHEMITMAPIHNGDKTVAILIGGVVSAFALVVIGAIVATVVVKFRYKMKRNVEVDAEKEVKRQMTFRKSEVMPHNKATSIQNVVV
ncbi:calcium-activated chloride channel regulator 3A-1-like [Glandiceps talaboti]